jgi:deoxyxylulose-5-phosphate synthase
MQTELRVPLVIRTTMGAGRRLAAQHSQSLHAWFAHVPGLKVVLPATPADAKGLLKSAIRSDDPVLFFEDKLMYRERGLVPVEEYVTPLGVAEVKRVGTDVTVVATSRMVGVALAAADQLAQEGVSIEVVDPRTLTPLDEETIVESVQKTSRCVIVDGGHLRLRRGRRDRRCCRTSSVRVPRRAGGARLRAGRAYSIQPDAGGRDDAKRREGLQLRKGACRLMAVALRQVVGLGRRTAE